MAKLDGPKYTSAIVIDLSDVKDELRDLPPGALKGSRGEKEGMDGALKELADVTPEQFEEADIHDVIYKRIVADTAVITKLRTHKLALEKALEVVNETLGMKENNREDDVSSIGRKAEETAAKSKKPGLAAHFDKTIAYKAQIADKAAATRRKNEEAEAEAGQSPPPAGPAGGVGVPPVT